MSQAAPQQPGWHDFTEDILNSAFDSILLLDPDGMIRHINPATLQLLGGKSSDLVGAHIKNLIVEIQDQEEDLFEFVSLERLITRGLIKNHRLNFMGSGERRIPVLLSASLIRDHRDDAVVGVLCIAKDLTEMVLAETLLEEERRASEERLTSLKDFAESIIRHMSDLLVVADDENRVIRFNNNFQRVMGFASADLEGRPLATIFESPARFDLLRESLESGEKASVREETYVVTRTGERIPVDLSLTVLIGRQGAREGVIVTARDIREKKDLQELKLKQQQLVLQAKLASLGELSGGIAHELNNPLSVITGYGDLLLEELTQDGSQADARLCSYVEKIRHAAEKMAGIVRHVREFSRQSAYEPGRTDLHTVLAKALSLTRQQLSARDIDIHLSLADCPVWMIGDPGQLEQVILGLLSNARQAIEEKGQKGIIKISSSLHEGVIELSIEDNGTGIREEHLARIFDPFFTTKEVGKGTGLGLSIAHGIITEHKGEISCTSEFGSGSRVTLRLPYVAKGTEE